MDKQTDKQRTNLEATEHVALGIGDGLALLACDQLGNLRLAWESVVSVQ
jgi:hypothetical protein